MIHLLAETSQYTPPPGFADWLQSAFYLLGIITAGVVLYKQLRPKPSQHMHVANQPVEVKGHVEYTPLATHKEFKTEVEIRLAAMSKASSEGRQKIYDLIRDENKRVHDRITELVRAVARVEGKIEHHPQ